eukprot:UN29841
MFQPISTSLNGLFSLIKDAFSTEEEQREEMLKKIELARHKLLVKLQRTVRQVGSLDFIKANLKHNKTRYIKKYNNNNSSAIEFYNKHVEFIEGHSKILREKMHILTRQRKKLDELDAHFSDPDFVTIDLEALTDCTLSACTDLNSKKLMELEKAVFFTHK